jgi:hypothetical protein
MILSIAKQELFSKPAPVQKCAFLDDRQQHLGSLPRHRAGGLAGAGSGYAYRPHTDCISAAFQTPVSIRRRPSWQWI